jgi:hypothetical protein
VVKCAKDNAPMRINLVTPFAEKDAAKALGARWDSKTKNWYIADVADLTPFLRWIPNLDATSEGLASGKIQPQIPTKATPRLAKAAKPAKLIVEVPHCGCNVLPWEDCIHTAKQ